MRIKIYTRTANGAQEHIRYIWRDAASMIFYKFYIYFNNDGYRRGCTNNNYKDCNIAYYNLLKEYIQSNFSSGVTLGGSGKTIQSGGGLTDIQKKYVIDNLYISPA